jgi:TRAP-type C4-dicarboxylate transport system permease small subunit
MKKPRSYWIGFILAGSSLAAQTVVDALGLPNFWLALPLLLFFTGVVLLFYPALSALLKR